jgi:hypothetical protein
MSMFAGRWGQTSVRQSANSCWIRTTKNLGTEVEHPANPALAMSERAKTRNATSPADGGTRTRTALSGQRILSRKNTANSLERTLGAF